MKIVTLLNRPYQVHDRLENFNINTPVSKGISFFGSNPDTGSLFVQFANGGTYIYSGVTTEVRKGLLNAPSIGQFVSKNIIHKFPSDKLDGIGVAPHQSPAFV